MNKDQFVFSGGKETAVTSLESRATQDHRPSAFADEIAQPEQPSLPVIVVKGNAVAHFLLVAVRVVIVPFDKGKTQSIGKRFSNQGLAATGHAHHHDLTDYTHQPDR